MYLENALNCFSILTTLSEIRKQTYTLKGTYYEKYFFFLRLGPFIWVFEVAVNSEPKAQNNPVTFLAASV